MKIVDKAVQWLASFAGTEAPPEAQFLTLNRKQTRTLASMRRKAAGKRRAAYYRAKQREVKA